MSAAVQTLDISPVGRVEGDLDNARYWYRRAHRPVPTGTLAAEWQAIVQELLEGQ